MLQLKLQNDTEIRFYLLRFKYFDGESLEVLPVRSQYLFHWKVVWASTEKKNTEDAEMTKKQKMAVKLESLYTK